MKTMTAPKYALIALVVLLFAASGCKKRPTVSPKALAQGISQYTSTAEAGTLTANAKMLTVEETEALFESADRNKKECPLIQDYCFALVALKNSGPQTQTAYVTNHGLASSSQVLPVLTDRFQASGNWLYVERMSHNGVSPKDKATLKSFACFSDEGKNSITVPAYGKVVRLIPLTKKTKNIDYKVKLAVTSKGSAETFHINLPI